MEHLTLSFFGAFQATLGDKSLTHFRSVKVHGLLVYLALTPQHAHPRDVLAALFWPDEPEIVAKKNLRQSLYRLRQLLGDTDSQKQSALSVPKGPFSLITHTTVQFNPVSDHSLDVADFLAALEEEDLETAVTLYQGDLLPGFTCDSLPFDDWLRQERERYHRLALDALFKLTAHSLAHADYQTAQNLARQQLTLEPWREEAHQQLIQALALHGERSAAIAQYETCRAVLAEELGIEPAAETKNLLKYIRHQRQAQSAAPPEAPQARPRLTIPFVGRQAEYGALVNAYGQVASNGLQVVILSGKAGVGKTRLTHHFLAWAAMQGADVLQSRALETSAGLPYQPLTHLLRQRIERENAPEDLLSDLWLSHLTRLLPELRDRYPDLPEPTQEENTAQQHLFEAITRLVQALAERQPLVLFIDDWHWADAASLDVLHYAAVRWAEGPHSRGAPILVLLTLRQEAVTESSEVQSWLTRLNHSVAVEPLQLGKLSRAETAQLIQTLLEPEIDNNDEALTQFSAWLFAETDGQPLFLTETLKAMVEDGLVRPDTASSSWHIDGEKFDREMQKASGRIVPGVQHIIKGWLDHLTAAAGKLLAAAAVLAQESTFDQLCGVAEVEEVEALTALDELLGKQLLLEMDQGVPAVGPEPVYSFSHQKISEVVYAEAGAARRRILHRRAFETLQAGAVPAADLAHHARNAGLLTETIHYSLIAGNDAMGLFAHQVAITHYETAWQLTEQKGWPKAISGADRQTLYTALGRAYEIVGAWPNAQKTYAAMIADARMTKAAAMECMGLNRLASVYVIGFFKLPQAFALLEEARLVAEASGDRRGIAETASTLSQAALYERDLPKAIREAEKALAIARELEHPQLLGLCLRQLSFAYVHQRQWELVMVYAAEAQQHYQAAGNLILAANNQTLFGACQLSTGKLRNSLVTLEETFAFNQKIENGGGQAECAWFLALVRLELGHYGAAIRLAKEAVTQAHKTKQMRLISIANTVLGLVLRTLMDINVAKQIQLSIVEASTEEKVDPYPDRTMSELCAIHALEGNWKQAHSYAKKGVQFLAGSALPPISWIGWYEIEALLRGGDSDLARAEVARLATVVGKNRRYRLPLLRSQAVLAQGDGDLDQAIEYLQAALSLAQEMGLPGEEWTILGELGRLYAERGEEKKAREAYGEAAVIIQRLAETIDDEGLREGFLTAVSVQAVLKQSNQV